MIKNSSVLIIILLICVSSFAQKTNSSPYSVLGIGDGIESKTVEEMSMGGTGTASNETYRLNFSNPASYSSLSLTTYTIAGENRGYTLKDANGSAKASNANLAYLALGIPMGTQGGFVFGIQPNTSVGYSLSNTILNSDDEVVEASIYEGSGGTNRIFLGVGYEPFKGFSIGLEGEYVFGTIEKSITNQALDVQLGTKYTTDSDIKGHALKVGFLYYKELKENLFLNLGANLGLENTLNSEGNEYLYSVSFDTGTTRDTILNEASKGTYKRPLKTSLGASIGNPSKWSANIDYSFQEAIELGGNLINRNPKLNYRSATKLSVGGFYIPKYNSISSYWDRVVYRAGVKMETTGLMIDGTGSGTNFTDVDDFGISFGVGLPMGNQVSKLNLGFEIGKRGTTDNGLIQENYFNFRLGLSLSNKWFRKREIN
ncbi:hypothetical protein [Urechidicola croceus]|uniref:Aromatic hydrocarbon degradation protein n=1 Tax=Urechidicola croceus TaxID=1850246 RepID=A0A1D8P762_9FLAO|nr:hypothetical protein [Urechidicola croceus]AOW20417.1 hypothetical protein LPB138_06900 [Urechidicola croceus]